ncbi:hypothetical protein [Enterococcus caccae]|uniref:Uncharacterized protein n=1 Tax=Enterococcus caccae ATCC BAA-1240 TaxID=1158612 RepID=R3WFW4_9ENTE|nr:hypothetical protein [Enterococcus caccae]EOL46352.1 hypothetical protein UC7_01319 [Enterococcus caccae ATCC BAA-1240]EOT60721.1 hypothetical protein I580_01621 [Enterococcus caccae ATCC BAA-1240]OJG27469.1 hypothetical protein RU98_GL002558 [Enterococcus caccae]
MVIVKKVNWIDEDSGEADVLLFDGMYSIESFCSDCNISEGDVFLDTLYGFNVRDIVKSFNKEYEIGKENNGYHIQGQLVDKERKILQIGGFKIDLSEGDIPKDIKQNDYIEVDISRVDIY